MQHILIPGLPEWAGVGSSHWTEPSGVSTGGHAGLRHPGQEAMERDHLPVTPTCSRFPPVTARQGGPRKVAPSGEGTRADGQTDKQTCPGRGHVALNAPLSNCLRALPGRCPSPSGLTEVQPSAELKVLPSCSGMNKEGSRDLLSNYTRPGAAAEISLHYRACSQAGTGVSRAEVAPTARPHGTSTALPEHPMTHELPDWRPHRPHII